MADGKVGAERIEAELRRIGDHLLEPTTFTLIGGCCMAFHEIKPSTWDTDAVVDCDSLRTLLEGLAAAGYDTVEEPATIAWDNYVVVERDDGIPMDLFPPTRIFDGPGWTNSMRARSTHRFTQGRLEVRLADLSTVFLLKAITGRWRDRRRPDRDLEDLRDIASKGRVDWDIVAKEWAAFDAPAAVREKAIEAMAHLRAAGQFVGWDPEAP